MTAKITRPTISGAVLSKMLFNLLDGMERPVVWVSSPAGSGKTTDVPADSPFHEMLAKGFEVIPEGIHVAVISRVDPPPALPRLHANDRIGLLQCGDIRFTVNESAELIHGCIPSLNSECVKSIHEKADGWAAGLILMLEREKFDETGTASAAVLDCKRDVLRCRRQ